jgi:hypothetical protein
MSLPYPGAGLSNKDLIGFLKVVKCHGLASAGIVIGTGSAAKVKWGSSIVACVNGNIVTVTTEEVAFTATTHDIAASASTVREAVYLVCVDSAGTVTLVMGDIASGSGNAVWPVAPTDKACVGAVRVAVAAGSTPFDASTDLLSAGHITDTYYNTICSPTDLGETLAA